MSVDHYGLHWKGKKEALLESQQPCRYHLIPPSFSGDVLIKGDNLPALQLLLATHQQKVDVIYIDPPYNTGKQFSYTDKFRHQPTYGLHDQWLSMIYPRLQLAHQMLAQTGVIFVSISDDEVHNLRILMDEIFGVNNFIGTFTWVKKKKGSHLSNTLRSMTEYILCFAKQKSKTNLYGEPAYSDKWQPLLKKQNRLKTLSFPANTVETRLGDGIQHPKQHPHLRFFEPLLIKDGKIQNSFSVEGPFVWVQKKLDAELILGTRVSLSTRLGFNVFRHDQAQKFKRPTSLLDRNAQVGTYEDAFAELQLLLGAKYKFTYAKPTSLLFYLLRAATHFRPNAIVMDFFAGSGSTGHATWKLNDADGGNRRFILIQNEEPLTDPRFATIAELTTARLRAAAKQLKKKEPSFSILQLQPSSSTGKQIC